jgi:hypothetical protein
MFIPWTVTVVKLKLTAHELCILGEEVWGNTSVLSAPQWLSWLGWRLESPVVIITDVHSQSLRRGTIRVYKWFCVTKSTVFCDITPCIPLKVNRRFVENIASIFRVVQWRWTYFSERSIDFQRTTQRYITEDSTLHNHCCKKSRFYIFIIIIIIIINFYST